MRQGRFSRTIATLYGNYTEDWVGKRVTLYATKTHSPAGETDCIRVRPVTPKAGTKEPLTTLDAG